MQEVRIPRPDVRPMRAALALPDGEGPWPGVIVIHEMFGLNRDIRDKAAEFARRGYAALAPDLYDGPGPRLLCVMRTMRSLSRGAGQAVDDLDAARTWLQARPEVDDSRIGVAGFCMGGGFALLMAAKADLGAAAVFYGAMPKDESLFDDFCPIVGGYGARDRVFAKQGRRLDEELTKRNIPHDVVVYPDAGHSFMSDHHGAITKAMSYGPLKVQFNPEAAADSWKRIDAFFGEHLRRVKS
jgi:carboxymethylenebutenolidase